MALCPHCWLGVDDSAAVSLVISHPIYRSRRPSVLICPNGLPFLVPLFAFLSMKVVSLVSSACYRKWVSAAEPRSLRFTSVRIGHGWLGLSYGRLSTRWFSYSRRRKCACRIWLLDSWGFKFWGLFGRIGIIITNQEAPMTATKFQKKYSNFIANAEKKTSVSTLRGNLCKFMLCPSLLLVVNYKKCLPGDWLMPQLEGLGMKIKICCRARCS